MRNGIRIGRRTLPAIAGARRRWAPMPVAIATIADGLLAPRSLPREDDGRSSALIELSGTKP